MIKRIQARPQWQRVLIFFGGIALIVVLVFALTLAVAWYGVNGSPRIRSVTMRDDFTVREFAQLPGDEAYPSALVVADDGTLYTGSYLDGTIWTIAPDGAVNEIAGTREALGSVTGLTLLPDHTLVALDRLDPLQPKGAVLWRIGEAGQPEKFAEIADQETIIPYDLTADDDGNLYVTVVVVGDPNHVLRLTLDGSQSIWWTAPEDATITGLTYDDSRQSILVVDTRQSVIYAIPTNAQDTVKEAKALYRYSETRTSPGFDGIDAAPDGTLSIAALGLNRVARLNVETGELVYLAGAFRGSSRVADDATRNRLYVNNWDQRSLLPEHVLFVQIDVQPRLPFTIDVVEPVTLQN